MSFSYRIDEVVVKESRVCTGNKLTWKEKRSGRDTTLEKYSNRGSMLGNDEIRKKDRIQTMPE
jgi:hypothetical protein